jgi:hypothetical protein
VRLWTALSRCAFFSAPIELRVERSSSRDLVLSRGHSYEVLFNDNTDNPEIVELLSEVVPT